MKKRSALIVASLVLLSVLLYLLQNFLFHDSRDTFFYMLQDWAFLPIQVALVTVIAGSIISRNEKESRIEKTRMLASSFFSELGEDLLVKLKPCVENESDLRPLLAVTPDWKEKDYDDAAAALKSADIRVNLKGTKPEGTKPDGTKPEGTKPDGTKPDGTGCAGTNLADLRDLLNAGKMSMLVISSNPVLLEHEDFSDMLWAIFHLTDELTLRNLEALSPADLAHLNSDAQRVLRETLLNWIRHMAHLKSDYPYLFQLEMYRSPFAGKCTSKS